MSIKRGELFWVNLNPVKGSEQAGRRPVLVIQNDIGNELAPTTKKELVFCLPAIWKK